MATRRNSTSCIIGATPMMMASSPLPSPRRRSPSKKKCSSTKNKSSRSGAAIVYDGHPLLGMNVTVKHHSANGPNRSKRSSHQRRRRNSINHTPITTTTETTTDALHDSSLISTRMQPITRSKSTGADRKYQHLLANPPAPLLLLQPGAKIEDSDDDEEGQDMNAVAANATATTTTATIKEVDFFENPTRLSRLVQYQMYDAALQHLETAPHEASTWVVAKRGGSSTAATSTATRTTTTTPQRILSSQHSQRRFLAIDDSNAAADAADAAAADSGSSSALTIKNIKKQFWIRSLPLHIAARNLRLIRSGNGASNDSAESVQALLNELIVTLIATYPAACRQRDHQGSLALHECLLYGANPETISTFLMMDPTLLFSSDKHGRTLAQLNQACCSPSSSSSGMPLGGGNHNNNHMNNTNKNTADDAFARRQAKIQELLELPVAFWQQAHQQAIAQLEQVDMLQQQQQQQDKKKSSADSVARSHSTSTDHSPALTKTTYEGSSSSPSSSPLSMTIAMNTTASSSSQAPKMPQQQLQDQQQQPQQQQHELQKQKRPGCPTTRSNSNKSLRLPPAKLASVMTSSVYTEDTSGTTWQHLEERAVTLETLLVTMSEKNSVLHGKLRKLVKSQRQQQQKEQQQQHKQQRSSSNRCHLLRDAQERSQVTGMKRDISSLHQENRAVREELRTLKRVLKHSKTELLKNEGPGAEANMLGPRLDASKSMAKEEEREEVADEEEMKRQRKQVKKLRKHYREMHERCKVQASRIRDLEEAVSSLPHAQQADQPAGTNNTASGGTTLPLFLSVSKSDDISCITPAAVGIHIDEEYHLNDVVDDLGAIEENNRCLFLDEDSDEDCYYEDDEDDDDDDDDDGDENEEYNSVNRALKARPKKEATDNKRKAAFRLPHAFDWLPASVVLPQTDDLDLLWSHAARQLVPHQARGDGGMLAMTLDLDAPPPPMSRQYHPAGEPDERQEQQQQHYRPQQQHIPPAPVAVPPPPPPPPPPRRPARRGSMSQSANGKQRRQRKLRVTI